jgi:hypothetical protein
MMIRIWYALLLTLTLAVSPGVAQSDALRGTWSGSWIPGSGVRDSVTVRFSMEGESVVGEMVNPESIEFEEVSFDGQNLSLVAKGQSDELGQVRIEAKIEEETRLEGMIMLGDTQGELRLTKWTFVPRPR